MLTICVLIVCYSMSESYSIEHDDEMVMGEDCTTGVRTPPPSRRCQTCQKIANSVDPHDTCVRCRGKSCTLQRCCVACLSLSDHDFETYLVYASRTLESPRSGSLKKRLPQPSLPNPATSRRGILRICHRRYPR